MDWMKVLSAVSVVFRYILPLLAGVLLFLCGKSLYVGRTTPEIWAWLTAPNGAQIPVTHWENTIGRSKSCDVCLQYPTISRLHCVLSRDDAGVWTIHDAGSKGGISVDGREVQHGEIQYGQVITLAGVELVLIPINHEQELAQADYRIRATVKRRPALLLCLLTGFQLFLLTALLPVIEAPLPLLCTVGAVIAAQWLLLGFYRLIRRDGFEQEILALFLCSLGLAVTASGAPGSLIKQGTCILLGMVVYLIIGWSLRNLARVKHVRYAAAVVGLLLLAFNLLFGRESGGARNWVYIGGISVQPSELIKLCFVLVGTSTLDRLVTKRNITLFLVYTLVLCLGLAILSDFGTALVFFVSFLLTAFIRSGDFAAVTLIGGGSAFAGLMAVRFLPYIRKRFSAWGHVWENALSTGYQQTRAMMCIAAGGIFGMGAGCGWLKNVAAADTDLVFAFVAEEYGLLMALLAVAALLLLVVFSVRMAPMGRSSFYSVAACTASGILAVQGILNVMGTVDLLPLTGVTFPFLSNGGSSMISVWGLLAFLKAADARQNASFAIKLPRKAMSST